MDLNMVKVIYDKSTAKTGVKAESFSSEKQDKGATLPFLLGIALGILARAAKWERERERGSEREKRRQEKTRKEEKRREAGRGEERREGGEGQGGERGRWRRDGGRNE
jgi:hypothetical protein